ncbi:MAG: Na+/H+ antiporter subunit E [Oceanicaulis sp.]|nr:Na+/H+ antiporter subunit E [Oceanicaulis sp.]
MSLPFVLIAAKRAALFALVWLVLSGGSAAGLGAALFAVPAAAVVSLILLPPGPRRLRLMRVLALLPGFLLRSVSGGVDVAWRALHPGLPVRPGWISVKTRMTDGVARSLYGAETSLLPGTLSAGCDAAGLKVHCLEVTARTEERLKIEERRLARAFSQDAVSQDGEDGRDDG